jgi:hypothetical protein
MNTLKDQDFSLDVVEADVGHDRGRLIALRAIIRVLTLLVLIESICGAISCRQTLSPRNFLIVISSNAIPLLLCFPLPLIISPLLSKIATPENKFLPWISQVAHDAALQFAIALPYSLNYHRNRFPCVHVSVAFFLALMLPLLVVTDYIMCARRKFHFRTAIIPVVYALSYWLIGPARIFKMKNLGDVHKFLQFEIRWMTPYIIGFLFTWCYRRVKTSKSVNPLPQ